MKTVAKVIFAEATVTLIGAILLGIAVVEIVGEILRIKGVL